VDYTSCVFPTPPRFNPTLVRLKEEQENVRATQPAQFQSHTGSIKRKHYITKKHKDCRFQSHTGSIKSLMQVTFGAVEDGFNPTLVRLKDFRIGVNTSYVYMFQSHTGSIKSFHFTYLEIFG